MKTKIKSLKKVSSRKVAMSDSALKHHGFLAHIKARKQMLEDFVPNSPEIKEISSTISRLEKA